MFNAQCSSFFCIFAAKNSKNQVYGKEERWKTAGKETGQRTLAEPVPASSE
jgi:hypothetical protein